MSSIKIKKRNKIKKRIKQKVFGNKSCPRLSVFRSNKEIYAQVINDLNGTTIVTASSREKDVNGSSRVENSILVGKLIAERSLAAGIKSVKFDRGGYLYHGRVKSLADGARDGGLKF